MVEHTFTHMLRNSGDVLTEVERGDVVLRRRDGEDLFLGLRSREDSLREALGVVSRALLIATLDDKLRQQIFGGLTTALPWAMFVPDKEREDFFAALIRTAAACVDIDAFEPLARLIEGWRAAAEVHANPDLVQLLSEEHPGPAVPLSRPKIG